MSFKALNLNPELLMVLPNQLQKPTEIQESAIPPALKHQDILALAQTGSGKTYAFGLPVLNSVQPNHSELQALVIVPTRELATQVSLALEPIAQSLNIRMVTLIGGQDRSEQERELALQPHIAVATPGRLLDLLKNQSIDVSTIKSLILDEADRLLDMGFWPDIQSILNELPSQRQTSLFSATFPKELEIIADKLLCKPVKISAHQENSVVSTIQETLYLVNKGSKAQALIALLQRNNWKQALVFIGAKDNADSLVKKLVKAKIKATALHGNKSQEERAETLDSFKRNDVDVLIATDVMARGIHIESLPIVINYDLPANSATYVHRIGRTARAGKSGQALSLVSHSETTYLDAIRKLTQKELPTTLLDGFLVTDKPAASDTTERKRPPKDKQANRRTAKKKSITQFKSKPTRTKISKGKPNSTK
ncbi:DEAD/DEAH box helicase [Vibrio sp. 99-70-13A1]|uniref:DEAD/DEAH box helicase n=1 Tax=Vibrio sp. 99-70-13A1 TaxID=2607601 RepID=UPI001493D93A|nr:DEAD/DEAH box helicase [Vibrio sp. 99-70-13A1]NOH98160.1 DEAD/DEAH box helicase [Vibrio sp. 99-70-13A1]